MTELIAFHGMDIEATCESGVPYANLRRLCECLGLAFQRQLEKLKTSHWAVVTNMVTTGRDGKSYEMAFVSADTIPMWLATINVNKVSAHLVPRLKALQQEMRDVLYRHYCEDSMAISVNRQSLIEMRERQDALQHRVEELFGMLVESSNRQNQWMENQMRLWDQLAPLLKRMDAKFDGERQRIKAADQRRILECVHKRYRGMCPCCQSHQILDERGERQPYAAEFEHFFSRSMCELHHVWIVCKRCNTKLRNRRPGGYWFVKVTAFQNFQQILTELNSQQMLLFAEALP